MFNGRTLKLKLFGILLSIDIDVSVRGLSMSIDVKRLEFNYYVHFGSTYTVPIDKILTLSGTGQGTFTLMSLLYQILSADFFFKNFETLL